MKELSDDELLSLLRDAATRRQGFAALVSRYSEELYWKIRRIVLSHDDANDVLQNTFIKAWTGLDSFRADSKLSTWLYSIAIHEALDFLRRQKSRPQGSGSEDAAMAVADHLRGDSYFDGDEAQLHLQQAIASLPEVQRIVFNMKYFDDMRYSDISQALGTSEGALKASYHLAVQKIRKYLERFE